ncbi:MAG: O-antigen ligase family protein [Leptonema sp. (in: Bacteria)]|nr:O-antigen ligase family protein [Leptonema sp. (in: bacteria)]
MQNHRINDYSLWFGLISIIGIPISISMSQGFLAVAVILVLISRYHSKFNDNTQPLPKSLRIVLIFGLSIYISWLLSAMIHSVIDRSIEPLVKATHSDLKDVWLILMSVWAFHHGSFSESHRRRLLRVVAIVFLIILLLGLVSSVTPFRLSKLFYHLQHGWHFSSEARLQHPMLHLPFGITFYMPVGLLGTHLAFGAQLAFFTIPITLYLVDHYLMKNIWSKYQLTIVILFVLALFVLLLNNARSAILGLLSALLAGILFLSCLKWRRSALKLILPPAIVLFLVTAVAIVNPNAGDLLMQSIGIEKKHSDYQRIMLWSVTSEVALDNVVVGVGPGMFSESVYNQMNQDAIDKPYLWYLYMQTERGHAHNDFLFQVTTAGFIGGFLFIAFWISLLSMVFRTRENQSQTLFENESESKSEIDSFLVSFLPFVRFSPILLLFGGLFQCYFLDDQVILPFWLFVGLAALKSK